MSKEDRFSASAESSKFFKGAVALFSVLDVEKVRADETAANKAAGGSIKTFAFATAPQILSADTVIAGGGMGGVAAALALGSDYSVILTEETAWLGGQLSAQGVAALDENKYIETTGGCANYLEMRTAIRNHYQNTGNLTAEASGDPILNPGKCWVTRLSFEPEVALRVLDDMLAPQISAGSLLLLKRTKLVAVHLVGDDNVEHQSGDSAHIDALLVVDLDSGKFIELHCRRAIDATELGDLMPLAKVPYQVGSDSRWITGEAHAPETANPDNVQDFTYPFILTYHAGENHTIAKPADYDSFVSAGKFSFDGYKMFEETDDVTLSGVKRHLLPFWTYRRLIDKDVFKPGVYQSDISMINWDSNDLRGKNIIDKSPETQKQYLSLAKRVSLGFLYWLQTEAPRDDGGAGYPELKLDLTLLGTEDGLSKYPYIREARRLAATQIVTEQDIVEADNKEARARLFSDSCGIGLYPVDIHGYQEIPGAAQQTKPFQIPLGALLTDYCANFVAACKNIGVTHITNGAYRLHPIEWAIGTAAGALTRLSLETKTQPLHIVEDSFALLRLQIELAQSGAPIFWFDDIEADSQYFVPAQVLSAAGLMPFDQDSLSFAPNKLMTEEEIEALIAQGEQNFFALANWQKEASTLQQQMPQASRGQFAEGIFTVLNAALQAVATTNV